MLTYGDGIGNIHLQRLEEFHRAHGKILTITGVRPPGRFGELISEPDGQGHRVQRKAAGERRQDIGRLFRVP